MKTPKCKNCGKTPKGYKEYDNPKVAKIWELSYCKTCNIIASFRESPISWKNFPSRHRWWIPTVRVMCILLFLAAISLALGGLEIGTWPRIVAGIIAFVTPGIYGALRGSGNAIPTEAETLEQLRNLLEE